MLFCSYTLVADPVFIDFFVCLMQWRATMPISPRNRSTRRWLQAIEIFCISLLKCQITSWAPMVSIWPGGQGLTGWWATACMSVFTNLGYIISRVEDNLQVLYKYLLQRTKMHMIVTTTRRWDLWHNPPCLATMARRITPQPLPRTHLWFCTSGEHMSMWTGTMTGWWEMTCLSSPSSVVISGVEYTLQVLYKDLPKRTKMHTTVTTTGRWLLRRNPRCPATMAWRSTTTRPLLPPHLLFWRT